MGSNNNIYVVYGTDYETSFGHKYFSNEEQAKDYKAYQEKIKQCDFEKYHIDTITIEDESIDYKSIKLFSTVTFSFDNYDKKSLSLEEDKRKRQIINYPDVEGAKLYRGCLSRIVVGDYKKTQVSVSYTFPITDESDIEKLLEKLNVLNEKIIKEASLLINSECKKNRKIKSDYENNFILSEKLTIQFKDEVKKIITS